MNTGAEVLAVEGVSVSLSGRRVLRNVSFTLAPGEFCALIGSNGSGKTTLLKTILGLLRPASGAVRIAGGSGRHGAGPVGYVPQKISLDPGLPLRARDVVSLGLDGGRLGLPLPSRERRARIERMLEAVGATAFADRRIGDLSRTAAAGVDRPCARPASEAAPSR
jgi:zinc/manganese transport system ATP-binding protein